MKLAKITMAVTLALTANIGYTAETESSVEKDNSEIENIVVIGTRSAPRSVADSSVPIDIIDDDELMKSGFGDISSVLTNIVPSYNVNTQSINDAATLVRPANLRGLPSDNTLVLVNGKRRHRASVITWTTGGVNNGAHGPDISVIPAIALKQVEVLRDGAAAQYGSDAIAGVINFQLKDDSEGGVLQFQTGEYYEGDGQSNLVAGNIGLPFTEDGFVNLSFELSESDATDRSVQRADAQGLIDAGNSYVANPVQVWGNPETKNNFKLFANIGLDLGNDKEFYLFGNWAEKEVVGSFYFRNPNNRGGVYGGPNNTLLVGDLTPDDGISCPTVNIVNNAPDPSGLQSIIDDPNCFSHYENIPGGFTPHFGGKVVDTAIAIGTKGELDSGILYDLSASIGRHASNFAITDTLNSAMGPDSPRDFSPGQYIELDTSYTLDLSYPLSVGWSDDEVNIAGGLEYREESFEIKSGDPASYSLGDTTLSLPLYKQGFNVGSNGFPGFKPEHAGLFERSNIAAYVDIEAYLSDDIRIGVAARYEDFSDFGATTNAKVSLHWKTTDNLSLRGSIGTGFRAPTVGQSNASNVSTSLNQEGNLVDQATLAPTNAIALLKGGKQLEAEDSTSFAFGAVFQFDELFVTVDYFNIEVKDRITLSKDFKVTDSDVASLEAIGILDASSFDSVKYFTNDFDTTTKGIDVVANYQVAMFGGDTKYSLAYNWTDTSIDNWNQEYVSETVVKQMEDGLPDQKATFTINHMNGDFDAFVRFVYFGEHYEAHAEVGDWPIDIDAALTVDAELSYAVSDNMQVSLGAQNIFDKYPNKNPYADILGAKYPVTAVMGFGGGYYYLRASYRF
ncbi:MAG: TonB-dependent receptor [Colwellia sp.]|nr:TonB-dependent receptor [Colwellia sp.]